VFKFVILPLTIFQYRGFRLSAPNVAFLKENFQAKQDFRSFFRPIVCREVECPFASAAVQRSNNISVTNVHYACKCMHAGTFMKRWTRARCFTDADYDRPMLIIGKSFTSTLYLFYTLSAPRHIATAGTSPAV